MHRTHGSRYALIDCSVTIIVDPVAEFSAAGSRCSGANSWSGRVSGIANVYAGCLARTDAHQALLVLICPLGAFVGNIVAIVVHTVTDLHRSGVRIRIIIVAICGSIEAVLVIVYAMLLPAQFLKNDHSVFESPFPIPVNISRNSGIYVGRYSDKEN